MLLVLNVSDFHRKNSRLHISSEIKLFSDLSQGKEQGVMLVHFVISFASKTCSRIPEIQEENVWTTNMYVP
jgi:hypothetical protein